MSTNENSPGIDVRARLADLIEDSERTTRRIKLLRDDIFNPERPGNVGPVPERPPVEPEPERPAPRPPLSGEFVQVTLGIGDEYTAFNFAAPAEGQTHLDRIGNIGIIAMLTEGIPIVCLCNPFPDVGEPIYYMGPRITWGDRVLLDAPGEHMLMPGQLKASFSDDTKQTGSHWTPGSEAQGACLQRIAKDRHAGFTQLGDVEVWGNKDINGGSGAGIYRHIGYWADHALGHDLLMDRLMGLAARCPVFRYDRQAWQEGRLSSPSRPDGFEGHAGPGFDTFPGYPGKAPRDPDGQLAWGPVDMAHLPRVSGLANRAAMRGNLFGCIVQDALAADLVAAWGWPTEHNGTHKNPMMWSAMDWINKGVFEKEGCPTAGRPIAHSILMLAEHYARTQLAETADTLEDLIDLEEHVQRPDGWVYVHHKQDLVTGAPSSAWQKKINAKTAVLGAMPVGGWPDKLTIGFENQLLVDALYRAAEVMDGPHGSVALEVGTKLANVCGPTPPEVIFIDAREHDATKKESWGSGLSPWKTLAPGLDLAKSAASSYVGDGPASAAHPSLWLAQQGGRS